MHCENVLFVFQCRNYSNDSYHINVSVQHGRNASAIKMKPMYVWVCCCYKFTNQTKQIVKLTGHIVFFFLIQTVIATVTQFNAVSFRVISSILIEPRLKPQVNKARRTLNMKAFHSMSLNVMKMQTFWFGARYIVECALIPQTMVLVGNRVNTTLQ